MERNCFPEQQEQQQQCVFYAFFSIRNAEYGQVTRQETGMTIYMKTHLLMTRIFVFGKGGKRKKRMNVNIF